MNEHGKQERIMTITVGLERGETSMNDTVEVTVNFDIPEDANVMVAGGFGDDRYVSSFVGPDMIDWKWLSGHVSRVLQIDRIVVITARDGVAPDSLFQSLEGGT